MTMTVRCRPEMQILIFVVNAGKKAVSSSSGMQTSVKTSALIDHRAKVVVPQRMRDIEAAIQAKDFETFGKITIQDSNQFHAICLDTYVMARITFTSESVASLSQKLWYRCSLLRMGERHLTGTLPFST